jgi:hypothetical protein
MLDETSLVIVSRFKQSIMPLDAGITAALRASPKGAA